MGCLTRSVAEIVFQRLGYRREQQMGPPHLLGRTARIFGKLSLHLDRRTSLERVAHLLCELTFRMGTIGIATVENCEMPFSQIVLADAVGLTPVHVSRAVGKLRRAGALEVTSGTFIVASLSRMAEIAGFDDNYLHRRLKHDRPAFGQSWFS